MKLINGARRERYVAEAPGRFRCELQMDDQAWRYSLIGWGATCQAAADDALNEGFRSRHPRPLAETLDRNGGRYAWQNGFDE